MYRNHSKLISAMLLVAAAFVRAQSPYEVAPNNYQLELENPYVRISRARYAPGDKLPVHTHPANPTVFVYLTDAGAIRFSHVTPEFTVERNPVTAGGVRYHTGAAETHTVEYLGSKQSEFLRVELKTERPDKKGQHIRMPVDDSRSFENSQLRINRVTCAAQQPCPGSEFPMVVVSLRPGGGGQAVWYEAGQTVRNNSAEAVRQIRIELKTKPAIEGASPAPHHDQH